MFSVRWQCFFSGDRKIADSNLKPFVFCTLSYVDYYNLPEPTDNVLELLAFIAKEHNLTRQTKSLAGKGHFTFENSECEQFSFTLTVTE